jgi:hypothetical protein
MGRDHSSTPWAKPTPVVAAAFLTVKPVRPLAALALLGPGVAGKSHGPHSCGLCREADGQQTPTPPTLMDRLYAARCVTGRAKQ